MFAQANDTDPSPNGNGDSAAGHPAADEGDRSGMYSDAQTGVTIASGGVTDPPYIVVMPDGEVHDAGLEEGDYLDIGTVQELLDVYGAKVY